MSSEDCFHLGAKALIVNNKGQLLLLQQNPKKSINTKAGRWDIPGGRIQKNETLEDTLRREVYEEIGIEQLYNIEPFLMVLTALRIRLSESDVGLIFATYLCSIPENSTICLSDEHIQYEWVSIDKAIEHLSHFPKSLLEKLALSNIGTGGLRLALESKN